jgi:Cytochrome C oxidase subunit II, transmembrane domain
MFQLLLLNHEYCDAPRPWGLYFQDSAAPQMEGLVELHDNIMFYLIIILFGVGWILTSVVRNYASTRSPISHKYLNHGRIFIYTQFFSNCLMLSNGRVFKRHDSLPLCARGKGFINSTKFNYSTLTPITTSLMGDRILRRGGYVCNRAF